MASWIVWPKVRFLNVDMLSLLCLLSQRRILGRVCIAVKPVDIMPACMLGGMYGSCCVCLAPYCLPAGPDGSSAVSWTKWPKVRVPHVGMPALLCSLFLLCMLCPSVLICLLCMLRTVCRSCCACCPNAVS